MTDFPVDGFNKVQVLNALQPWREWLPGKPMVDYSERRLHGLEHEFPHLPGVERVCNLRFDAEYEPRDSSEIRVLSTEAVNILIDLIAIDMTDLLTYGDIEQSSDALLKAFTGTRKRGYHAKQLQFPRVALYQEFKPRKGALGYTLYTTPYIEWDN